MISVLTPSIRKEALAIVAYSLQRQTVEEFEWLIGSPFDPEIPWARWIPDTFEGGFWTLNRMYNKLLQEAKGELIVSWQDSIYIPPQGLETFQDDFRGLDGLCIVSGIGDQYKQPHGLGKPIEKIWDDPRRNGGKTNSFYECNFPDVEWNWCAFRKGTIETVGGFDEGLDALGFGMDGYQVNERLNEAKGHFYLDHANESYTIRHDRSAHGGQEAWDQHNLLSNGKYEKRRVELIEQGLWPVVDNSKVDQLETMEEVKLNDIR